MRVEIAEVYHITIPHTFIFEQMYWRMLQIEGYVFWASVVSALIFPFSFTLYDQSMF